MEFVPYRFVHPDKSKAEFFATLRKRVDQYFKENNLSKHCNGAMILKTVILLLAYVVPFILILSVPLSNWASLLLWTINGLALAGIGMSVMHDANHGAYSASSRVNYWLGHTLNMLGGSVHNWKLQHNVLHHTYTNIVHADDDIDDKLILRFSPHTQVKWYHRFQIVYAIFFYGIITLYWSTFKDFVQFSRYNREKVNKADKTENRMIFFKLVFSKVIYFAIVIGLPLLVLDLPAGPYILGYLLSNFVAGIVLTVIFQLAHTVEETTHPLPNENFTIENNWAIHQMETTVNFSRKSKVLGWYLGGLNFQVEHHLFPNICHVHYPALAPIVKATAEEFGVPYLEHETFGRALMSHLRTLIRFGRMPNINEAVA